MIFIVEPGGWTAEKATPLSASSAPVRGSIAAIPANRPASRVDRGLLDRRVDRRRDRVARDRRDPREHAFAREQLAAGRPRQLGLEDVLEAVEPDLGVRGVPRHRVLGGLVRRDRAELADDLRGDVGNRRGPVGSLRQRRAVARQQRRPRRQRGPARQLLAATQPGEQQHLREADRRPRAAAVERHVQRLGQRAEQARARRTSGPGSRRRRGFRCATGRPTSASRFPPRVLYAATNCASDIRRRDVLSSSEYMCV